jgi:SAM-dependent methyltransferase
VRFRYDAAATLGRWRTARQVVAERGWLYLLRIAALWAASPLWRPYYKVFPRSFEFAAARHTYFLHNYNLTWSNERAVEIPIVRALLAEHRGRHILEVGNVLSHYSAGDHEVLDKFETGPSVTNEDVVAFRSPVPYDLIVSISTLEHVGWDEEPKDPGKILRAVANLGEQLAPGGRMLVTLPLGYNPDMDALLARDAIPFTHRYCLRRQGWCDWREVPWEEIAGSRYGEGWPGARGLVIGITER